MENCDKCRLKREEGGNSYIFLYNNNFFLSFDISLGNVHYSRNFTCWIQQFKCLITFILQMRKLRHKEFKSLAQGRMSSQGKGWDSNPGSQAVEATLWRHQTGKLVNLCLKLVKQPAGKACYLEMWREVQEEIVKSWVWLLLGNRVGSKDKVRECFLLVLFNLYRCRDTPMRWGQELARKKQEGTFCVDGVALFPDWGLRYSVLLSELSQGYL